MTSPDRYLSRFTLHPRQQKVAEKLLGQEAGGRLEPGRPRTLPSPLVPCVVGGTLLKLSVPGSPHLSTDRGNARVSTLLGTKQTNMFMLAVAWFAVSWACR